jgi:hypothetical protein
MPQPVETAVIAHPAPVEPLIAICPQTILSRSYAAQAIMAVGPEIAELLRAHRSRRQSSPHLDFFLGRVSLFPGNQPVVLLVRSAAAWKELSIFMRRRFAVSQPAICVASII